MRNLISKIGHLGQQRLNGRNITGQSNVEITIASRNVSAFPFQLTFRRFRCENNVQTTSL